MLQNSISSSPLIKQAATAVQAQQFERPLMARARLDYLGVAFSSRRSREDFSVLPSVSSCGLASPGSVEKHIHFNEQVKQCRALDMKGNDEDEVDPYINDDSDDLEDGAIMMKRLNSKHELPVPSSKNRTPRNRFSTGGKGTDANAKTIETIAFLPSTTLKYREDTFEPYETAVKHSNGFWSSGKISHSPSQETFVRRNPLKGFF
jgi:hypothetical protein